MGLFCFKIYEQRQDERCSDLPRGVDPGEVGEVGIHGNGHDFAVHVMELIGFVTESDNFRRTHKGARKKGQKISSESLKTRI